MIPMLAWIANSAPAQLKATFFAVMASFTNLPLSLKHSRHQVPEPTLPCHLEGPGSDHWRLGGTGGWQRAGHPAHYHDRAQFAPATGNHAHYLEITVPYSLIAFLSGRA